MLCIGDHVSQPEREDSDRRERNGYRQEDGLLGDGGNFVNAVGHKAHVCRY